MSDSGPAIDVRRLTRAFGATAAVTDLSLRVDPGEMFALVGPDGAGKSTAIRLLCGLLKPDSGTGAILGLDLLARREKIKARIGYLSQEFTLYGDLTVDENMEFFADIHGVRRWKERRDELLAFTRLTPFRRRFAQALSGGMKKKLALACTLIHTPDILFLDEPSTGVDPVSRGEFWNILSGLLGQGVTILMTTPYLDEAERCHRLGLMHSGRLVETGAPAEIKARFPGRLYNVATANLDAAHAALKAHWPAARLVRYGDRLHFWSDAPERDLPVARRHLADGPAAEASFVEVEPSLEDVFVAFMRPQQEMEGVQS